MTRDFKNAKRSQKNPDPVISLNRQFSKLMIGKPMPRIFDKMVKDSNGKYTGERIITKNRYEAGGRIYQMQTDFCYLIKEVKQAGGKNAIRRCQDFINRCRDELSKAAANA